VAGERIAAEVVGEVAPYGVDVVRAALAVVVFDEYPLALDPIIVRLALLGAARPKEGQAVAPKLYRQDVGHDKIVVALTPLIDRYSREPDRGGLCGDFVIRTGYVAPTTPDCDFHANLSPDLAA
jgi:hypothetical protein